MDAATRQFVRSRASERCEYCRLPQAAAPFFTFHVEHVEAQQHVLDDSPDNLALACPAVAPGFAPGAALGLLLSGALTPTPDNSSSRRFKTRR